MKVFLISYLKNHNHIKVIRDNKQTKWGGIDIHENAEA